jgi:MscS family membrane protein
MRLLIGMKKFADIRWVLLSTGVILLTVLQMASIVLAQDSTSLQLPLPGPIAASMDSTGEASSNQPAAEAQTNPSTTVQSEELVSEDASDDQQLVADSKEQSDSPISQLPGARMLDEAPNVEWSISASRVFWAIIIFMIGHFGIKYATKLFEYVAERRVRSRLSIKAAIPILRIFGWTFVIYFIVARVFAPPIETVLALTASLGIAIGFAAQDILKNIFGGVMILLDRPFSVGDKIEVGSHYGEVLSIGLRTVRLVTADDSVVSVPNAEVAAQPVSNVNSGGYVLMVVV